MAMLMMGYRQAGFDKVAKIIADRDGEDLEDVKDTLRETLDEVADALANGGADPEDVWTMGTGLEPDYLIEIIQL